MGNPELGLELQRGSNKAVVSVHGGFLRVRRLPSFRLFHFLMRSEETVRHAAGDVVGLDVNSRGSTGTGPAKPNLMS